MFNKKGFTIIELMIVLAIISVVLTIAVSSMANTVQHLRLNSAAGELMSNINRARMTAIARNGNCVISFNKAENSYMIFMDDDSSGLVSWQKDEAEDMLASKAMPSGITIAKASFSLGTSAFGYGGNGLPLGNRMGSVCLKNDKNEYYKLSVSWTGRPKLFKNVKKSECI